MSVGSSPVRFDALAKTQGTAMYPGDRVAEDATCLATSMGSPSSTNRF